MKNQWLLIVLIVAIFFGSSTICRSGALLKYKDIRLNAGQIERLAEHDHLIRYYCENLLLYGEENRVDPNFIRALILAESNVNKNAVSADNAYGLTQITMATGNQAVREIEKVRRKISGVKKKDGLNKLTAEDLLEPNINIFIATYLISKYNSKYDGRLDLVVAAWNAGPGSIKNDMPPNYSETLDIIGKVNGYYHTLLHLKGMGLSFLQE